MGQTHTIRMRLSRQPVEIVVGSGHLNQLGSRLRRMALGTHPILLSNPNILRRHGKAIQKALRRVGGPVATLTVADTEQSKSLPSLSRLLSALAKLDGPGKRPFLVLAGGGVVGDLGGVAAGLYKRGIPYVQLPTTLLAQVDSAIGGKTAVDLPQGKNLVGLIVQPRLIFVESKFLETLPERQFRSGLAEVAKGGIIRDAALFKALEKSSTQQLRKGADRLSWALYRAMRVKAAVVEQDEFETKGIRTILNLGHTFGHALETASGYRRAYTHGEAVAVGIRVAADMSKSLGLISACSADRIRSLLRHLGLPVTFRGVRLADITRAMSHDKKWFTGRNRWVLPTGIGRCTVKENIPAHVITKAIRGAWEG